MRPSTAFGRAAVLLALLGIVLAGLATPPAASAADLDHHYHGTSSGAHHFPPYFGLHEPWTRSEERPPRPGIWFYTRKPPRSVNFLVPMKDYHEYVRPEPWTPAWFDYCARRWPSFNPKTGTIVTPDGVRMCM